MIYKKIVKRCWKSLTIEQKKDIRRMLRDYHDRIIYETSEAARLEKMNLLHTHEEYIIYQIDGTRVEFDIAIKIRKNFYK